MGSCYHIAPLPATQHKTMFLENKGTVFYCLKVAEKCSENDRNSRSAADCDAITVTTSLEEPANFMHFNIPKHTVNVGPIERLSHRDDEVTWQQRRLCRESRRPAWKPRGHVTAQSPTSPGLSINPA